MCVCLKCGHRWYPRMYALHERHLAIVSHFWDSEYDGITYNISRDTRLTLSTDGVRIICVGKRECFVPYDEIVEIDHREAIGVLYGRLFVRCKSNMRKPIPKTYSQAQKDKFTIIYPAHLSSAMNEVNNALNRIIEENKRAGLTE